MEPGDCIYWKGTSSHIWDVGHVEMYIGDGNASGTAPAPAR
jgi:hypothetical protein